LKALLVDKAMAELTRELELHSKRINNWKRNLIEHAANVIGAGTEPVSVGLCPLQAKIVQLALDNDFFESALTKVGLLSAKR
jgi:transposase